ncbi:Thioesterase/thiol ester dehydrase-isomerase [Mycena floridula]|nr:Thioesterase/thiol ester dehydrase-isomerase [Mycena floridula]
MTQRHVAHLPVFHERRCLMLRFIPRFATYRRNFSTNIPTKSRKFSSILLALGLSTATYALGSVYPPSTLLLFFPRTAPPPLEAGSTEAEKYTSTLEAELQSLPLLNALRQKQDPTNEWFEMRPYTNFPEHLRVNHLTAGVLRGPGKLALFPIARIKKDESEGVFFIHLGRALCGHDGIVHGGVLATLLDEALARTAISNLPDQVGVTATLNINYRAPTRADQFVVIKTQFKELKGRKSFVAGRIEDLQGNLLVEADAMFVQPRYAKLLANGAVLKAMRKQPNEESAKR